MDLYETELADAKARLAALGRDPAQFDFTMEYLPPDPDGAGMFTVHYAVTATNRGSGASAGYIGGIGTGWVDYFEETVKAGELD
jgi:hypothetical protein